MEFLVVALDGTDTDAPSRRMASREAHLAAFKTLKEQGHVVSGGALLDDDGGMIGSALILDFPDRASVEQCIAGDPYTKGDVWRDVTIRPFRLVR
ncbi:MAG: YciI family protein [Alphaproteobacteria bacterium]|nr:YciI family protein [Alphaproteobacteria bacterium]